MKKVRARGVMQSVAVVCLSIVFSNSVQAATIRVEAWIDGQSQLTLKGDTAQWHHIAWDAPGRNGGHNYATIFNYNAWFPRWPDIPNANNTNCNCNSDVNWGIVPALSAVAQTVTLNPIQARGSATIIQQPSAANNYSLIVDFNDPAGGSAWYIVELSFASAAAIPVPAMSEWGMGILVLLVGLGSVFYLRRGNCA